MPTTSVNSRLMKRISRSCTWRSSFASSAGRLTPVDADRGLEESFDESFCGSLSISRGMSAAPFCKWSIIPASSRLVHVVIARGWRLRIALPIALILQTAQAALLGGALMGALLSRAQDQRGNGGRSAFVVERDVDDVAGAHVAHLPGPQV